METKLLIIPQVPESERKYLLSVLVKATKRSEFKPVSVRVLVDEYKINQYMPHNYNFTGYVNDELVFDSVVECYEVLDNGN